MQTYLIPWFQKIRIIIDNSDFLKKFQLEIYNHFHLSSKRGNEILLIRIWKKLREVEKKKKSGKIGIKILHFEN